MKKKEGNRKYIAKTLFGFEDILADELSSIGAENIVKARRAVFFDGNKELMYRANLQLRTALSVLVPVYQTTIEKQDDLYDALREFEWNNYLSNRKTFAIDSVCNSKIFNHSKYLAYRAKDAISDYFRMKYGARPDVKVKDPDVKINVHLAEKELTISLDSSGEPLFKRGYREFQGIAPLNEVLAAGIIKLSKWDGEELFVNPMCGSGTLGIEAALMAKNIAPGIFRKKFGFETWFSFNKKDYTNILDELDETSLKSEIVCSDIKKEIVEGAKKNISNASLTGNIKLMQNDFFKIPDYNSGTVIINPPYGERLKEADINTFYKHTGDILKKKLSGCNVWLISSNMEALKNIGLKPSEKIELYNGSIKCKLLRFEIYSGTRKEEKSII